MPVAARTHIDTQLRGDGVAGGRCGRNSERLRVPKKQNGQRGTPGSFCSSRKLLLGDCKASGRVRNDACSALAHVGKQAGGRKCSIVLPSTNLGPAGWPWGSTGATEGCVSHRYRGRDFPQRARLHLPRVSRETALLGCLCQPFPKSQKTCFWS